MDGADALAACDGVVAGGDPVVDADGLAVAEAEALVERVGVGLLVRETLLPSELFSDWPVSLDGEAGGRIVVAAPFTNEGPLPSSSV